MVQAVIVAAGQGKRMGNRGVDKLFQPVAGRPLIAHAWAQFDRANCLDAIVLVVRDGRQLEFHEVAKRFGFEKPYTLVLGGAERQDSVWNGIEALHPACEIVAIHDGARAAVDAELIGATVEAARQAGAAVAAQRMTDTVKTSSDGLWIAEHLDRSTVWAVQTPQTFRVDVIRKALSEVRRRGLNVTDDTAACALIGHPVRLVESQRPNPKLTRPEDVPYFELLLSRSLPQRAAQPQPNSDAGARTSGPARSCIHQPDRL